MQVRYYLEVVIYFMLSITFQLSITTFSTEYNILFNRMSNPSGETIEEEMINRYTIFEEGYEKIKPEIIYSLQISIVLLLMSSRVIFVTLHNWLTKRDYTYQIDDFCDLVYICLIITWIMDYIKLKDLPLD